MPCRRPSGGRGSRFARAPGRLACSRFPALPPSPESNHRAHPVSRPDSHCALRPHLSRPIAATVILSTLAAVAGCSDPAAAPQAIGAAGAPAAATATAPAAAAGARQELLQLAEGAASSMPVDPHAKDRARLQESVVLAWLEHGQPDRALTLARRIQDWRRGTALAAVARHRLDHGEGGHVASLLDEAEQVAMRQMSRTDAQAWRSQRIAVTVAGVRLRRGDAEGAARLLAMVGGSEAARTLVDRIAMAPVDELAERLVELDQALVGADLDTTRHVIAAGIEALARCHGDVGLQQEVLGRIDRALLGVPAQIGIQTRLDLADACLGRADLVGARAQLVLARTALRDGRWLPEQEIPLAARLAVLRHRAGEPAEARAAAAAALGLFDRSRDRMVDIYRAGPLLSLAVAFHQLGEPAVALTLCRRAVDEAVVNPNSRPRADDLVAICLAMARSGCLPDAALRDRLQAQVAGLGDPW